MDENKQPLGEQPNESGKNPVPHQDSTSNEIDEVLGLLHKNHPAPPVSHGTDSTVVIGAVPTPQPQQKPHEQAQPEPTRVDLTPVKPPHKPQPTPHPTQHHTPAPRSESHTPSVSLDDFNTAAAPVSEDTRPAGKRIKSSEAGVKVTFLGSAKFGAIKVLLYIAFVIGCAALLSSTVIHVANDVFAFVKPTEEVVIHIPEGTTTAELSEILHDAGVIKYPGIFKMFAGFRISKRAYLNGTYLTGDFTVNPMMNYDTLLDTLSDYERRATGTVRITIPEGLTVGETIDLLVQNGVGKKEDYTEALQSFDYEYRFAKELTKDKLSEYRFDTAYSYRLEGYLFPDTYDFYLNENPVSALDRFLTNFDRKFEEEFYDRCEELGMTVDQVITLASLIEKEGNNAEDYYYISSVFHNRLNNSANFPYLNSDASLQYAMSERGGLYGLDTSLDHPYNTYKYRGLPPGPICNPGMEAIYAALYPYKTSYYYFYTKKNGETVYSRTLEEHNRYVNADKTAAE